MGDAREWLLDSKYYYYSEDDQGGLGVHRMINALLAVLAECDRWDVEWFITNWPVAGHRSPPTAPIRAAIDKTLGVDR